MSDRCDGIFQCIDKSDEDECKLITINKQIYDKDYPPRKEEGDALDVKVKFIIDAIQNVKELHMTFGSKLTLMLEWHDERVRFSNLKQDDLTNLVGYDKALNIWIPPLIFNNTQENKMVVLDKTASLFVNKRGEPQMAALSSINEDYFYKGSDNILLYRIDYKLTYSCVFRLERYPFDTQTCQIEVCTIGCHNRQE